MWREQNFANAFANLVGKRETDAAKVLANATGGRKESFFAQATTERLLGEIADELHTQYLLSFPGSAERAAKFRRIHVAVKNRPETVARTRFGYWPNPG